MFKNIVKNVVNTVRNVVNTVSRAVNPKASFAPQVKAPPRPPPQQMQSLRQPVSLPKITPKPTPAPTPAPRMDFTPPRTSGGSAQLGQPKPQPQIQPTSTQPRPEPQIRPAPTRPDQPQQSGGSFLDKINQIRSSMEQTERNLKDRFTKITGREFGSEYHNIPQFAKNLWTGITTGRKGSRDWLIPELGFSEFFLPGKVQTADRAPSGVDMGSSSSFGELMKKGKGATGSWEENVNSIAKEQQQKEDAMRSELTKLQETSKTPIPGIGAAEDFWASIYGENSQGTQELNNLYNQVAEGGISLEDYERESNRVRKEQAERFYNQLVAESEKDIPGYEKYLADSIKLAKENLTELETRAGEKKVKVGEKWGETLRRIPRERVAATQRLGNIFSGLGTAESSEAIRQLADVEKEYGGMAFRDERSMNEELKAVDDELETRRKESDLRIKELTDDANTKIEAVRKNIRMTRAQQVDALENINLDTANKISEIKADTRNKQMEFANLRAQILNSRANIMAQGLMDERLLKAQQEIEAARLKQYNMYGGQETGTTLPIQGALPKAAYNSPLVVVGPDGKRYMKQFNPTTNDYEYVPI